MNDIEELRRLDSAQPWRIVSAILVLLLVGCEVIIVPNKYIGDAYSLSPKEGARNLEAILKRERLWAQKVIEIGNVPISHEWYPEGGGKFVNWPPMPPPPDQLASVDTASLTTKRCILKFRAVDAPLGSLQRARDIVTGTTPYAILGVEEEQISIPLSTVRTILFVQFEFTYFSPDVAWFRGAPVYRNIWWIGLSYVDLPDDFGAEWKQKSLQLLKKKASQQEAYEYYTDTVPFSFRFSSQEDFQAALHALAALCIGITNSSSLSIP